MVHQSASTDGTEAPDPHSSAFDRRFPPGSIKAVYPLTALQEGMLFHHLLNPDTDTYVLSALFELAGKSSMDVLVRCVQAAVARHDALRIAIVWEGVPKPVQVVLREVTIPVERLTAASPENALALSRRVMRPGEYEAIDPSQAPMLRLTLVAAGDECTYAVLRVHHLICDHQSLSRLIAEINDLAAGRALQSLEATSFDSHISRLLERVDAQRANEFFRAKLKGVEETTAPFGLHDVHGGGGAREEARALLGAELTNVLRDRARCSNVSVARVFHAAWALVVSRTTGKDDVVYGTVLGSPRNRSAGGSQTLGLTVNTLPIRLRLCGLTAADFVEQTHRELAQLVEFWGASLPLAQRASELPPSTPLFTSLLNYRRTPAGLGQESAVGIRLLDRGEAWTNYPISVTVDDHGTDILLMAKTVQAISPQRVLDLLVTAVRSLGAALDSAPHTPVVFLNVLSEQERRAAVIDLNATDTPYPRGQRLDELFEATARRLPQEIAVVCGDRSITYRELDVKASQLGNYLRAQGVGIDDPVGLCLERGIEQVVVIFAIMKAGAAYVPLDPSYPAERLKFIVDDALPRVVITERRQLGKLATAAPAVIVLDEQWDEIEKSGRDPRGSHALRACASSLAYVIYTSGSTGHPKGVMVDHRNVASLWSGIERVYEQVPGCTRVAINASLSFDASVKQLVELLSGRTLVIVPDEARWDPSRLFALIDKHRIDAIDCTPSQLKTWIAAGLLEADQRAHRLRLVLIGGEAIDPELWHTLARSETTVFYNVYGPTESTVDATFARIAASTSRPHIGPPMQNRRIYILDSWGQVVSVGVAGEIYIGGEGIARGYLRRPQLTAERFLPDPFCGMSNRRMYRTGDLGRVTASGTIEYIGRSDSQVKVRGFRIELAEIEAKILQREVIKAAAVIVHEDALVAYVVPNHDILGQAPLRIEVLRAHLKQVLPDYMVPTIYVQIDQVPLTPNGKLDRRALPKPDGSAYISRIYEPPEGEIEQTLAELWRKLLGVERVGRNDGFFELGGHSLTIVQMLGGLRGLGLRLDVRSVFEKETLKDVAAGIEREVREVAIPQTEIPANCARVTPAMLPLVQLTQEQLDAIVATVPDGAGNVQDIYPLAPLQEGILFHHLVDRDGPDVYVVPTLLQTASKQKLTQLIRAFQWAVERHDVLRTAIVWERLPHPVQVVYRRAVLSAEEVTVAKIRDELDATHQRMNLTRAPLLQVQFARMDGDEWLVRVQIHHIVDDGASLEMLMGEITAYLQGNDNLVPRSVPYRRHVARTLVRSKDGTAERFFTEKLADVAEPTAPFGLTDVRGDGTRIEEAAKRMTPRVAERVHAIARASSVSAATLLHAAWALVVAHTSNRDDVVFGTVLLGRLHGEAGAPGALGLFINTLPLRLRMSGCSVSDLVEMTRRELAELLVYEQESLALAQRCSGIAARAPLFSTLFNYRLRARTSDADWIRAEGIQLVSRHAYTNYPITVSVDDLGGELLITAQTDRELVDPRRVAEYLETAIESLVDALEIAPNSAALSLTVMPPLERRLVIEQLNDTRVHYPRRVLIHQLFEEQVRRSPDASAVVYGSEALSYAQLDVRADRVALCLRARGVGPDKLVAICTERSLEMVVGLLGILKAGGAYVPLDPSYPSERLQYMLEDAAPSLVLTQTALSERLPTTAADVIALDTDLHDLQEDGGDVQARIEPQTQPENLLYVIYTSGSTGRPKGTAMPHQAMVNLIEWHRQHLPIRQPTRVLQFAALSFDVAFQETFSTLCTGGTLVLVDEWVRRDARALLELLSSQRVDRAFLPPMMLQTLAEHVKQAGGVPGTLKDVITAGEQLRISAEIVQFFAQLPGCRLHNHYGPTETHVVTALTLAGEPRQWPVLPTIGGPIANTQIYILDRSHRPVPLGVIGEIYIAGANVARGYLNRPQLTAERFIQDPFSDDDRVRMYKTGDLGRWRADGSIEYLGRNDDQVKIRGFRIEPGEIEARLALHVQVKEAAVVVREDVPGQKRLVAYTTPRDRNDPSAEELRNHLRADLPEHMVPSAFVSLPSMPLTPSGKLNRRALPAPELDAYTSARYEPPQGEIEQALADIWQELLHLDRVGRDDDVFELGAHSLSAMQFVARVQPLISMSLPIRSLFEHPTVRQLAVQVEARRTEQSLSRLAGDEGEDALWEQVAMLPESEAQRLLEAIANENRC